MWPVVLGLLALFLVGNALSAGTDATGLEVLGAVLEVGALVALLVLAVRLVARRRAGR